jgi:hypothetical protein
VLPQIGLRVQRRRVHRLVLPEDGGVGSRKRSDDLAAVTAVVVRGTSPAYRLQRLPPIAPLPTH